MNCIDIKYITAPVIWHLLEKQCNNQPQINHAFSLPCSLRIIQRDIHDTSSGMNIVNTCWCSYFRPQSQFYAPQSQTYMLTLEGLNISKTRVDVLNTCKPSIITAFTYPGCVIHWHKRWECPQFWRLWQQYWRVKRSLLRCPPGWQGGCSGCITRAWQLSAPWHLPPIAALPEVLKMCTAHLSVREN